MNPLAKLFLYALAVVLVAALLSPPAYWLLHDAHPWLGTVPFRRFFSRTALITALVLLWPALRWMNVRRLSELGLERDARALPRGLAGVAMALLPLLALGGVYLAADVWRIRGDIEWGRLPMVLGAAAAVPFAEEFLFRGVLLGLAVRSLGRWPGAAAVSLVFAAVHFIDSRHDVQDVRWGSGFEVLAHAFSNSGGALLAFFGGACLFVLGLVFALATLRTRSLWLAIGLHAGCILGQQTLNLVAKFRVKPPDAALPWFGPNIVHGMVPTGLVPLAALLVMGGLVWWYLSRELRQPFAAAARDAG